MIYQRLPFSLNLHLNEQISIIIIIINHPNICSTLKYILSTCQLLGIRGETKEISTTNSSIIAIQYPSKYCTSMYVTCSSILCFHFACKNIYAARARRMLGSFHKKIRRKSRRNIEISRVLIDTTRILSISRVTQVHRSNQKMDRSKRLALLIRSKNRSPEVQNAIYDQLFTEFQSINDRNSSRREI